MNNSGTYGRKECECRYFTCADVKRKDGTISKVIYTNGDIFQRNWELEDCEYADKSNDNFSYEQNDYQ